MYDEEQDELKAQFNRTGEYRRTNPDLAVGSTAQLPESAPVESCKEIPHVIRVRPDGSIYCPHPHCDGDK